MDNRPSGRHNYVREFNVMRTLAGKIFKSFVKDEARQLCTGIPSKLCIYLRSRMTQCTHEEKKKEAVYILQK
jgi:hypothetical protein